MPREDSGAAVVVASVERAEGHHRVLAGDLRSVAEDVGIADGLADDDDAFVAHRRDEPARGVAGEPGVGGELAEAPVVGVDGFVHRGDECGGAEDDVARAEDDASAVAFDGVALVAEAGVVGGLVLAPLDVDVRADALEQLRGAGMVIDVDPVDAIELGEVVCAEFLGDQRPAVALGHLAVAGDGDEEDVALCARVAEVPDVARVDDVETAVAVDQAAACGAGVFAELDEAIEREDLAIAAGGRGRSGWSWSGWFWAGVLHDPGCIGAGAWRGRDRCALRAVCAVVAGSGESAGPA